MLIGFDLDDCSSQRWNAVKSAGIQEASDTVDVKVHF